MSSHHSAEHNVTQVQAAMPAALHTCATGHRDVFGPQVVFLTDLAQDQQAYALAHAIFPADVFVPVHSHEDRETFYIISGVLEAWDGQAWIKVQAGESLDIPGHQPHAWRNSSGKEATTLLVTTVKMGHFFEGMMVEAASLPPGPPTPEALQRLGALSDAAGYVMGTPEDNVRAGLTPL